MNGTAGTLTIGPTGVIKTVTGFGGTAQIGPTFQFGGNMTLVNQGTISSEVSGKTINVATTGLTNTNSGTLQSTSGGTVSINSTWSSSGSLAANGGTLSTNGTWSNTGSLTVNGGTLNLGGTFTTAGLNLAAYSRTGGTVNVTGTLNNTGDTLTLNAATGA